MLRYKTTFISLLALTMTACNGSQADSKENTEAVKKLIQKTKDNMVLVEGGSFQMGDFGQIDPAVGNLPYSVNKDDKNIHKVILDDYYISSEQVSYSDFEIYANSTGQPKLTITDFGSRFYAPDTPAGVNWEQAHDYCQWLGAQTGLSYSLPTEAQWEYAARGRGKFTPFSTNDGTFQRGKNVPSEDEIRQTIVEGKDPEAFEIASIQPNSLDIYQMGLNGLEWVNDWYNEDYYTNSPEKNPMGPQDGTEKVLRGGGFGSSQQEMLTMRRSKANPDLKRDVSNLSDSPQLQKLLSKRSAFETTFRCAIN
ncbi:Formylglycine-generating enzyme, required for sulfatase activity, contains SUMF1/FGE domain [Kushneria avicenniae]|uniref:Formylglycine-generating enzyme, required for sulfatase activity, contains SUMF1/FGE domain n=2 Tax=Kushneria avicenniae TaxID=402385 RepID=A0A1I1K199_9GAMM|nr:Formylglycine-generating enzyme, required for sulfatase activity, contains SUMF1/FGE domain [Kushneria avicenniae]